MTAQTVAPPERPPRPGSSARRVIGLLVEPRYRSQRQPARLAESLRSLGHQVRDLDASDAVRLGDQRWCEDLAVLLCRGRSPGVLALLAEAELAGVRCVNRPDAIAAVVNKARIHLAAAGIPVPDTFLGPAEAVAARADDRFPLILKPTCGDNANGLRIVWHRQELLDLNWPEPLMLAQPFYSGTPGDLKLYVAGRQVWAVRRPSPIDQTHGGPVATLGVPVRVSVTDALERVALRCGDVFGLDLYGVDCLETTDGPIVLEVNDFPNYSGLADADPALAALVLGEMAA
jgi:ribosomal protein S6--L-glutamate ligase